MKGTLKRVSAFLLLASLTVGIFTGCAGAQSSAPAPAAGNETNTGSNAAAPAGDQTITLKFAHVLAATGHYEAGAKKFAELVKEKSGGKIVIETYPGGVLGSERDMIEAMQLGTLDMGLVSSAPLGGFLPEMMLFDLPFLFRDREHAWGVADGEIGTDLFNRLDSQKLVGLAYWENGFRMLFSNFPVNSPEDIKGKKIRVMENAVHMRSFEALGAIPTPMAYGELFTALQQKTIDGAENSIICIATDKFNEACGNLALTGHFYGIVPLLMSKSVFEKLTPEQQNIIKEAAVEARDWQRQYTVDNEDSYIKSLKESGMNITEPDRETFRKICEPIYSEFYNSIPKEMIDAVINS